MMPFLSLQFKAVSYNGVRISLLNMAPLAVISQHPNNGLIFDRSKDKRLILLISLAIATVTLFLIPYLRAFGAMLVITPLLGVIISSSIAMAKTSLIRSQPIKTVRRKPPLAACACGVRWALR